MSFHEFLESVWVMVREGRLPQHPSKITFSTGDELSCVYDGHRPIAFFEGSDAAWELYVYGSGAALVVTRPRHVTTYYTSIGDRLVPIE